MNYKIKDNSYKAAMDAMNSGAYVTIIFYVCVPRGTDYIAGKTFDRCILQCEKK